MQDLNSTQKSNAFSRALTRIRAEASELEQAEQKPVNAGALNPQDDVDDLEKFFTEQLGLGIENDVSMQSEGSNPTELEDDSSDYDDDWVSEEDAEAEYADDSTQSSSERSTEHFEPVQTNPAAGSTDAGMKQELEEVKRQNAELMKLILQQQQELLNTQQFIQQAQNKYTAEQQAVHSTNQGFEHLSFEPCTSEFCGQSFKYDRYEEPVQFSKRFERGLSDEDTAKNYLDLCREVCADIETKFGGWDRITDFAVVSDLLIINSVSYEPILPNGYADSLPFDLRTNVTNGCFAWVFDFNLLRKMTNLVNLKFDSADFVYAKVRKDMHIVSDFSCKSLFKACKNLMNLQIGQQVITRANPTEDADLFKRASRADEIYQKCCDNTWVFTKNRWGSIRDVFHDPDKSGLAKVWGITWRGVATVGGLASHVGTRGVGLLGKMGKGIRNIAAAVKDNM